MILQQNLQLTTFDRRALVLTWTSGLQSIVAAVLNLMTLTLIPGHPTCSGYRRSTESREQMGLAKTKYFLRRLVFVWIYFFQQHAGHDCIGKLISKEIWKVDVDWGMHYLDQRCRRTCSSTGIKVRLPAQKCIRHPGAIYRIDKDGRNICFFFSSYHILSFFNTFEFVQKCCTPKTGGSPIDSYFWMVSRPPLLMDNPTCFNTHVGLAMTREVQKVEMGGCGY